MALVEITEESLAKAMAETDWTRLDAMTDEEIEAAVASDPDAPPIITPERFVMLRVRHIRKTTGLTQEAFSERYGIPVENLSAWEQGTAMPDATARSYLRIIEKRPEVAEVLTGPGSLIPA